MVTEVKLYCFHGRGSTMAVELENILLFLNEFGYCKLFELYLIIYFRCCGTTMAVEKEHFTSNTMVKLRLYKQMIWWIGTLNEAFTIQMVGVTRLYFHTTL